MKTLTKGQRFALAREARRLAMECVEGTAPEFGRGWFGTMRQPSCALGHIRSRAKVRDLSEVYLEHEALILAVQDANDDPPDAAGRRAALPAALLALADELEASETSARKRPQKQSPGVP